MNNSKTGSYGRLIAFFLVAVIVLCAFGFAVEGWQTKDNTPTDNSGTSTNPEGEIPGAEAPSDDVQAGANPQLPTNPSSTDYITGLEISDDELNLSYISFTLDSTAPLYGIHSTELLIEIPIENDTRYLVFTKNVKEIGKIGSIAPTRAYISALTKSFCSVLVSLGNDDTVNYPSIDISDKHFDLTKNIGYSYTEYSKYNYSNGQLIDAGLTNLDISLDCQDAHTVPYTFADLSEGLISGNLPAQSVTLPFGDTSSTKLTYSQEKGTYILSKNDSTKIDLLTDSPLEFTNVFVLFADSITYEDEGGSEMVMNTAGSGKGIYITAGTAQNITWVSDESGAMTFLDESQNILTVNRGTSYIGFVKSARMADVKFS